MRSIVKLRVALDERSLADLETISMTRFARVGLKVAIVDLPLENTGKLDALPFVASWSPARMGALTRPIPALSLGCLHLCPQLNEKLLHDAGFVGEGIKVAILDTEFDETIIKSSGYKDFWQEDNSASGASQSLASSETDNLRSTKTAGHGAVVARIIQRFAPHCTLYAAKVGEGDDVPEETVIRAMDWAREMGVDIINASWGFPFTDCDNGERCAVCSLVNEFREEGIFTVIAAGNRGEDGVSCPARAEGSIAVGAVNGNGDAVAAYSSYDEAGGEKPDIIAPGEVCFHSVPCHGTSFSTPCITGILAALMSRTRQKHHVVDMMLRTAKDIGDESHRQGRGLIDLPALIKSLEGGVIA